MTGGPLVSVFTPSHQPRWLDECHRGLVAQTYPHWEWVVVLNHGARWEAPDYPRVRVVSSAEAVGVGAAKRRACGEARGEILLELDHDDVLLPTTLQRVVTAYAEHSDAALVYSHCAQVLENGERDDSRFNPANGWEYAEVDVDGRQLVHAVSMAPTPHNVSYIWFAPDHLRAFSRTAVRRRGRLRRGPHRARTTRT